MILVKSVLERLEARKDEEMSVGKRSAEDITLEEERIEELLEAARLACMSSAGLTRAAKLVREKARDV